MKRLSLAAPRNCVRKKGAKRRSRSRANWLACPAAAGAAPRPSDAGSPAAASVPAPMSLHAAGTAAAAREEAEDEEEDGREDMGGMEQEGKQDNAGSDAGACSGRTGGCEPGAAPTPDDAEGALMLPPLSAAAAPETSRHDTAPHPGAQGDTRHAPPAHFPCSPCDPRHTGLAPRTAETTAATGDRATAEAAAQCSPSAWCSRSWMRRVIHHTPNRMSGMDSPATSSGATGSQPRSLAALPA